jgi:poly(A) polymerase
MILPLAAWRERGGLEALLDALDAAGGRTRYVGGAVRDTLLGLPVTDIDCATTLPPEEVRDRIAAAGFKAVPTGIAHGTVTAVLPDGPVEVTTLRRDVSTDGRRATVAYTDDWRQDASRRDFTINALSADPVSGEVYDFFGGADDLAAGRVRFIGEPLQRIAEDHLRILRFFRFHARFGRGEPDAAGLAACVARANDLMALSRERIADELLKLLEADDPAPTVVLMAGLGIFRPVLPEIGDEGAERLAELTRRERSIDTPPSGLRRLAALLPPDPAVVADVATRLKLSNAAKRRLGQVAARDPGDIARPRVAAYRVGEESAVDRILIGAASGEEAADAFAALVGWSRPSLPIGGGELIALGLKPGPAVARTLRAVEERWIGEGFPGEERVRELAEEEVAQALRERK